MGQIIGSAAKPKRCNLNKLSQLGTPAAGEHILVSSDNSMNAAGQGNFDCYIVGVGNVAATALELKSIASKEVTKNDKNSVAGGAVFNYIKSFFHDEDVQVGDFADGYFNTNAATLPSTRNSVANCKSAKLSVAEGEVYEIYGTAANNNYYRLYALYDTNGNRVDRYASSGSYSTTPLELTIPSGVATMVVNLTSYNSATDKLILNGAYIDLKEINSSVSELEQSDAETKEELKEKVSYAVEKNYIEGGFFRNYVIIPDESWRITDFIPITSGSHRYVWNFGYGNYTATGGPSFVFFDENKVGVNYFACTGYTDTRIFELEVTGAKYIRVSYYPTLGDGTTNDIPVYIDDAPFKVHGTTTGYSSESVDSKWKKLQLGKLINKDISNGQIYDNPTWNDKRVVMNDVLVLPKTGIRIRLKAPKTLYKLQSYFWYGSSDGTINLTAGSILERNGEITLPSTAKAFRIVFRATYNYSSSTTYDVPISAQTFQQWIDSGELAVEYYDGYVNNVLDRNLHTLVNIDALKRNLSLVNRTDCGMDNLPVFAHTSDLHGDATRFKNMMSYCDLVGGIDAALNSGDAIMYQHRDGTSYVDKISSEHTTPVLTCIGNHESIPTGVSTLFADNIAGLVEHNGYLKSAGIAADHCYYYKDFSNKSTRVIVLNYYEDGVYAGRLGQTQITWFINTLLSTPSGYGILVMLHSPEDKVVAESPFDKFMQPSPKYGDSYQTDGFYIGNRPIMKIVDAFISRTTISETYDDHSSTYNGSGDKTTESVTISADFTNVPSTTEFIAYITGHRHEDCVGYYDHSTQMQLCLCIVCGNAMFGDSSNSAWTNQCDLPRNENGVSQDAFNVYSIDRSNGEVRIVRVGADVTIKFEKRDMMIIPYKD